MKTSNEYTWFMNAPRAELAARVREAGPQVCVFPVNGSRRWFLAHRNDPNRAPGADYFSAVTHRFAQIVEMFFAHGVDTLLIPALSPHILEARSMSYRHEALSGLTKLCADERFAALYARLGVCVRFYGEYRSSLTGSGDAKVLEAIDELTRRTASHTDHRLFWGLDAHDPVAATIRLSVAFHAEHGRAPSVEELVERYYGESIPPVCMFITFGKPRAYGMPLLGRGRENLYFSVAPSLDFDEPALRRVLHDHLVLRPKLELDYASYGASELDELGRFYRSNRDQVLGLGRREGAGGWIPVASVSPMHSTRDQEAS